jgi:hypothetical protein
MVCTPTEAVMVITWIMILEMIDWASKAIM